jgi:hypothetical protein
MFTNKKYIKRISAGFLLFYTFFLLLAAFHTHKTRSQSGSDYQFAQIQNDNKDFDPLLDENSNCQLCQFSSSKIVLNQKLDLAAHLPQESSIPQIIFSNHYSSRYFYNFDLRAPPSIS